MKIQYYLDLDAKFDEVIIARKNKEKEMEQELITFNEAIASHNKQKELLQYKLDKLL